jgi:hypothetical protein
MYWYKHVNGKTYHVPDEDMGHDDPYERLSGDSIVYWLHKRDDDQVIDVFWPELKVIEK